jgi:hypothetical protein
MKTFAWDGQLPIKKPGLYAKVPMENYHTQAILPGPSISSGGLRRILKESPAHFFDQWDGNPDRAEQEETPRYFILGAAVHHLLLGEPGFAARYAIQPAEYEDDNGRMKKWNNNANDCKAWHEDRKEEGREVLLAEEVEQIRGMATAISRHWIQKVGGLNGAIERSIFWQDEVTGVWLKNRPDVIPTDSPLFVDLKTTRSVQMNDLVTRLGWLSYHMQAALTRRAAREVLGFKSIEFHLCFVEVKRPHCVRVVTLKDSDLDLGERENQAAIQIFARCLKSGHWPGPGGDRPDAEYIELSERAREFNEDRLDMMEE